MVARPTNNHQREAALTPRTTPYISSTNICFFKVRTCSVPASAAYSCELRSSLPPARANAAARAARSLSQARSPARRGLTGTALGTWVHARAASRWSSDRQRRTDGAVPSFATTAAVSPATGRHCVHTRNRIHVQITSTLLILYSQDDNTCACTKCGWPMKGHPNPKKKTSTSPKGDPKK